MRQLSGVNKDIFISILIPTYNRAHYISDAIGSALAQDYPNFEIVVVDDGSTDNTSQVVRSFNDARLRYILKEHSGAPATRNRCISEAHGEFVLWLDSDDRLFPGILQKYASIILNYPDIDVSYGDLEITDTSFIQTHSLKYPDWYKHSKELLACMFVNNCVPNPGTMVRSACYKKFGGYDESYKRAHDYEFWTRLAKTAKFKHVGCTVVQWRWHDSNMSSGSVTYDKRFEVRILKNMLERFSLAELLPKLNWCNGVKEETESTAWGLAAKSFLALGNFSGALQCLNNAYQCNPDSNYIEAVLNLSLLQMEASKNNCDGLDYQTYYEKVYSLRRQLLQLHSSQMVADDLKLTLLSKINSNQQVQGAKLVSIIIPYFKQLDTVAETLTSIANQTYRNFEVILVNDGDTEHVLKLFKQFAIKNPDIQCYYHYKPNSGLADTRNFGIKQASGHYILPLDSDDMLASVFLEQTVSVLDQHPEFGFVYTEALFWGSKNEIWATTDFDPRVLLQRNLMTCTTLYKRQMWEAIGGYNTNMKYGYEDWDFWISAVEKGFIGTNIHLPLFIYRRKTNSMLEQRHKYDVLAKQQIIENHPSLYHPITEFSIQALSQHIGIIPSKCLQKDIKDKILFPVLKKKQNNQIDPPKILFVCHDFPPYKLAGAQLFALRIAQELQKSGHDVAIFYPVNRSARNSDEDDTLYKITKSSYENITVWQITVDDQETSLYQNPQYCFQHPQVEEAFRNLLITEQIDIVHFHLLYRLSTGLPLIAKELHIPTVATLHDYWLICAMGHLLDTSGQECTGPESPEKCADCYNGFKGKPAAELVQFFKQRLAATHAAHDAVDVTFSPSSFLADCHQSYGFKRPEVLPLGWIPVQAATKKSAGEKITFGYLGQIISRKGLDILLIAVSQLTHKNWELKIYGEVYQPGWFEPLDEFIQKHPQIHYCGAYKTEDLNNLYAEIDVAVVPSRRENYPLTVMEALSAKVPVIAADVGGVKEIMIDGQDGFIVKPHEPLELKNAMEQFLTNPALAERMQATIRPIKTIADNALEYGKVYRFLQINQVKQQG